MPAVIIRLRVFVTHERFGGERFVAAFPRDRVRDLIARLLVEAGIEDDPREWELADDAGALDPGRTVGEVLEREPPWNGWALRPIAPVGRNGVVPAAPRPAPPPPAKPPVSPPPPPGPVTHFTDALLAKKIIGPEQLEDARRLAASTGVKLQDALQKLNYATAAECMSAVAEARGMAFVDLTEVEIPKAVIELVPESVARENLVLPLALDGNTLTVATSDPANYDAVQKLEFILNKTILPVLATREQIQEALNRYYGQTETESVDSMLVEFTDTAIEATKTDGVPSVTFEAAPATAPRAKPAAAPRDEPAAEIADDEDDLDDEEFDEDEEAPPPRGRAGAAPATRARAKTASRDKAKSMQRRATVRYYRRMNPDRVVPLLVMLTREEVERVVKRHVEQAATGPLAIKKDMPLEIEPVLPGCAVHPPKVVTRLGEADTAFTFHIAPHVLGEVTGARVIIRQDHTTLAEIPLDMRVVQRTLVVASGLSTFLLPAASAAMRHFGVDFTPKDGSSPYLAALNLLFGQLSPLLLTGILGAVTVLAWWLTRPEKRDVFWDISTKPGKRGE